MRSLKKNNQLKAMKKGGKLLAEIRQQVIEKVRPGISTLELDSFANKLIEKTGGKASFKMVDGYNLATCININSGVVHGIPTDTPLKENDVVTIDVGLFYRGFHTDTATTAIVGEGKEKDKDFLQVGKIALMKSITKAAAGNKVSDVSKIIQKSIESNGFSCAKTLTGHGVGKNLHEEPSIPCVVLNDQDHSELLKAGQTLAIEVIYMQGKPDIIVESDGWTISTKDGKNAAVFEETVVVKESGSEIITANEFI